MLRLGVRDASQKARTSLCVSGSESGSGTSSVGVKGRSLPQDMEARALEALEIAANSTDDDDLLHRICEGLHEALWRSALAERHRTLQHA